MHQNASARVVGAIPQECETPSYRLLLCWSFPNVYGFVTEAGRDLLKTFELTTLVKWGRDRALDALNARGSSDMNRHKGRVDYCRMSFRIPSHMSSVGTTDHMGRGSS